MKNRLNEFNAIISATKSQYYLANNKNVSNADQLIEYAAHLSGGDEFEIWDNIYDNDDTVSNTLSENRYYANKNNILFQTESASKKLTGAISCYDITTGTMKNITDKAEIFDLLYSMKGCKNDILTDSNSNKITKDKFINSKLAVNLTKDGFVFTSKDDDIDTRASGDPHYYADDVHVFDFQGKNGGEYLELDSDEMKLISKRKSYSNGATVIVDESVELKGSNITVVAHKDGKYDVHYTDSDNKDIIIMNQDGAQVNNASEILANAGVSVNLSGINLSVNYKDRTADLQLGKGCINDLTSVKYGDTGIRSQVVGVYDSKTEGNTDGTVTIDGNVYFYDENQQDMVAENGHTGYNLDRVITTGGKNITVRQAILNDLAKLDTDGTVDGWLTDIDRSKKRISLASAYNSSSGYTATEFDEFMAELLYTDDSKYF